MTISDFKLDYRTIVIKKHIHLKVKQKNDQWNKFATPVRAGPPIATLFLI